MVVGACHPSSAETGSVRSVSSSTSSSSTISNRLCLLLRFFVFHVFFPLGDVATDVVSGVWLILNGERVGCGVWGRKPDF